MRKIVVIAPIALVLAGGLSYFAITRYADYEAGRQIDRVIDGLKAEGFEASRGAVAYDLFANRLEAKDIAVSTPAGERLHIAGLTASGLAQPATDRIRVEQVELRELSVERPVSLAPAITGQVRVPQVVVTGFEGATRVSATANEPLPVALAFVEAARIARIQIPTASSTLRSGPQDMAVESDVTYHNIVVEDVASGRIARSTVEQAVFQIGGNAAAAGQGEIGPVRTEGADIATALILLDPVRRQAETGSRQLYGAVTGENYRFKAGNGTAEEWKTIRLGEVSVRPAGLPTEELIAIGLRLREMAAAGDEPQAQEVAEFMDTLASVYDALTIKGASFEGLKATEPTATVKLDSLTFGTLENGRLDSFALNGLSGTEQTGATATGATSPGTAAPSAEAPRPFRLDRLTVKGLRPGIAMRFAGEVSVSPRTAQDPVTLLRLLGVVDGIELNGLEAATAPGEAVTIDTFALSWSARPGALPTRLAFTLRAAAPTAGMGEAAKAGLLLPPDVSRASIAADLGLQWAEADRTLTLAPVYAEISDSFAFHGSARLTDVGPAAFAAEPDAALGAMMAANLASVEVKLTDSGLYEQKLAEAAREQGATPEALRQLLAGFSEMMLSPLTEDRPDFRPAVEQLTAFLARPMGTLALRLTPRNPPLPLANAVLAAQNDPIELLNEVNIEALDPQ